MIDHAQEVRNLLTDPRQLCESLGLTDGSKPGSGGLIIRCPNHEDRTASCSVTRGPDGTLRAKCFACDWSADAIGMIAKVYGLDTRSDFREILRIGAEIGGDLLLADEIGGASPAQPRAPVPQPEPEPEREYPDPEDVGRVWVAGQPCESDANVFELLRSRAIDPDAATRLGLARVLSDSEALPTWATYQRASWLESGHRMVCRVVDSNGAVRSLRAWQVDGKSGPKRLPPAGCRAQGLVLANREAVGMLAGKVRPNALVVCEGEPDWLTWSTRAAKGVAVVGIGSGLWTRDHATKIPKTCRVLVRTHCDEAGDRYAAEVADTIGDRAPLWRLVGTHGVDENDKAKAGQLPAGPAEGCEPVNEPARRIQEETPRILTVQQILSASFERASNQEAPKTLTTGHWKADEMTGGIRPGHTWVIGADTSWGKSSMAIAIADENILAGHRVLIVSTEDDESIYGDRLMARRARVRARDMRDRCLCREDLQKLNNVLTKAEPLPVYLDGRGVTFERLSHQIETVMVNEQIDLVFLDYIQECRTKKRHDDDRRMFREIARLFRTVVKRHKRSGVILSQLTISDPSKAPTKNEVRECKDMAHGAEVVALGWKPDRNIDINGERLYDKGQRVLIIDKAKDGECGHVALEWDQNSACFNRVLKPDDHPLDFHSTRVDLFDAIDDGGNWS